MTDRCPQCRGLVRPGAPWCTQCWTDLRPAPPPPRAAEPTGEVPGRLPAGGGLPAEFRSELPAGLPTALPAGLRGQLPAEPRAVPTQAAASAPVKRGLGGWPCTVCHAVNAIELDTCAECGSGFLAGASSTDAGLVVPGLGDLTKVSRAQRLAVAGGVALLFMALVALVGLLG
ncbi:MAG TPA: hypothetical protein VNU26_08260 [Mycobacteriales bacterium]|nr:hypothetical protein [Mycobacteriales bacterium]